jgi:hypothetical protein
MEGTKMNSFTKTSCTVKDTLIQATCPDSRLRAVGEGARACIQLVVGGYVVTDSASFRLTKKVKEKLRKSGMETVGITFNGIQ